MTFMAIIAAVSNGKTVCWKQDNYVVEMWSNGPHVVCTNNGHACGLFWLDGVKSDYDPADFYVKA